MSGLQDRRNLLYAQSANRQAGIFQRKGECERMQKDDLSLILEKHLKWLRGEDGGERANLSGANLSRANLSGADLSRANLSRADLSRANLYGANLSEANLSRANLSGANLSRADLSRADLYGANLSRANLSGADLSRANLSRADLYGANLSRANLSRANLSRADLSRANLYGANLSEANLYGANLSEANLSGAKNLDLSKYAPDLSILKSQPADTKLIAYKFLNSNLTSPYQKFQYTIGQSYEFDCDPDQAKTCSNGGNVATLAWCKRNMISDQILVEVSFLAGDVVIPFATDGKFRVKKFTIERLIQGEKNGL
jgi:uncharacterized protein YjbI with pentapeptide repeats